MYRVQMECCSVAEKHVIFNKRVSRRKSEEKNQGIPDDKYDEFLSFMLEWEQHIHNCESRQEYRVEAEEEYVLEAQSNETRYSQTEGHEPKSFVEGFLRCSKHSEEPTLREIQTWNESHDWREAINV